MLKSSLNNFDECGIGLRGYKLFNDIFILVSAIFISFFGMLMIIEKRFKTNEKFLAVKETYERNSASVVLVVFFLHTQKLLVSLS